MSATAKQADAGQQIPEETAASTPVEERAPVSQCEIDEIIRKRVYAAIALGMAPLPLLDLLGLYGIQVELVHALAKKYDVPFKADRAKALVASLVGSVVPVSLAPVVASVAKFIPFIGWTASLTSMCIAGGASTYALGRVFDKHFASGGTLLQADKEKLSEAFKEKFEEGKKFVGKLGKKGAPAAQETAETQAAG